MAGPKVTFATAPRMVAASLKHNGSYSRIGETMEKLAEWARAKKLEPAGNPFCLYYDNPGETPVDELRSEACIPVRRSFRGEGEVVPKEFPEAAVAETRHLGPPETFGMTYGPFLEGLLKQGYRLVGPAREYYRAPADVKGPGSGYLIQQPVSRPSVE